MRPPPERVRPGSPTARRGATGPAGSRFVEAGVGLDARTVRRSLVGAAAGGGLFAVVSLYRSWVSPGPLLDYAGPVGLMVVIGATVGGLVGPLAGRIVARRRETDGDGEAGRGGGDGGSGDGGEEARRQPLWVTLVAGLGVGFGVGTAWDRVWVGLGLGLVLALLARRVFR